jgi:ring-1,2-phenylacetyl-CoA epoxidase subunit PaaE
MSAFHPLTISDIRRETSDSVSLAFAVPTALKKQFAFVPGQYLTVRTLLNGADCRRSYSICSGLTDGDLRIAIKKVPGGIFSTFANDQLQAGTALEVMPPEGRFTASPPFAGHLAFFAAGSGITPVLSIIRSLLAATSDSRATLIYGNRTTSSIMFRTELEELKDTHLGRLSVLHVLSRESQDIDILNGHIDGDKVARLARSVVRPTETDAYYLCGPFGMVEAGRAALVAAGVEPTRIKSELFFTEGMAKPVPRVAPAKTEVKAGTSRVDCVLDGVTYQVAVKSDEHVVDAASAQGLELPYSCKGGMCCTCRCKVAAGEVVMDLNYSLEPWELKAGFVLACQARPLTPNVKLDFDAV